MKYPFFTLLASFFLWSPEFYATLYNEPKALAKSIYLIATHSSKENFHYKGVNEENIDPKMMDQPVIICLHGDKSYPATFIPTIDKLREEKGNIPIFVPYMNYGNEETSDPRERGALNNLETLLSSLQSQYQAQGKHLKVIFIGHSMGGITASYYTYSMRKVDVLGIIGISSRLRHTNDSNEPSLKVMLETIEKTQTSEVPYYAIFGDEDWLVPLDAMNVVDEKHTYIVHKKSHLGALYDDEALTFALKAIKNTCE